MQHIFHKGGCPRVRGWGYCPQFFHQSYTHLQTIFHIRASGWQSLGQGPWCEWEGELSNDSSSYGSFALWDGTSQWPSAWRLAPDVSSTRSLDLAAMDMKLVAVSWNSRYSHSLWVQRPWQEIKQTTWFEVTVSLSHFLGLCLYATNGAPSQMWGCLWPRRKVVTYLQQPRSMAN